MPSFDSLSFLLYTSNLFHIFIILDLKQETKDFSIRMALTIEQLALIGRYLNIYLGSFMFIAGLIGSSINIWLFTRHCFRKSPCSRFILVSSIFDIIHLIVALFLRILAEGFDIDPASLTVIGCRIRYYL